MKHFGKRVVMVILLVAILGFGTAWVLRSDNHESASFVTEPVQRGDLTMAISATGTVEPEEVVDVGAQVAGKIVSFGKDQSGRTIDYGSSVEEGTILAQIDDSIYDANVAEAKAQLDVAKAGVLRAQADLGHLQAKLFQAERDWKRAKKLGPSDALSQSDFDAAQSAYEVARANVAVGEAASVQAKSSVEQAEATLRRAQQNLDYCTIKSPVKGVIVDRRVNIGQTVVASLNAPSLFLIAKDLTRMQVWVAVNEADVGRIKPGQPVTFTVDAFPGDTFTGEVGKVRLNASMTQNVVTYTVEILTDNSSGRLLPYLTANVRFQLEQVNRALLVPNSALRWKPSSEQVAPEVRDALKKLAERKRASEGGGGPGPESAAPAGERPGTGVVWIAEGNFVRPVRVRVGLSDGGTTAVEGEKLSEEMSVVIGVQAKSESVEDTGNPFAPQFMRGSGRAGAR
jgi:HlyD family secretion protein